MKTLQDYVGQELTPELEKELNKRGVRTGGMGTCDYDMTRANVEVDENNIITGYSYH